MLNSEQSQFNYSPSDYARISRDLSKNDNLRNINIAFLSSYTMEVLNSYVRVELEKRGFFSSTYFAPYNNFEQEIIDNNSVLNNSDPDVVVIHNRIEDISQGILMRFYDYTDSELENDILSIMLRFNNILKLLREKSNAKIVVINFANTQSIGFESSPLIHSLNKYIQIMNNKLLQICSKISSCYVANYFQLLMEFGFNNWLDPKLYYLGRIPFGGEAQIRVGKF